MLVGFVAVWCFCGCSWCIVFWIVFVTRLGVGCGLCLVLLDFFVSFVILLRDVITFGVNCGCIGWCLGTQF